MASSGSCGELSFGISRRKRLRCLRRDTTHVALLSFAVLSLFLWVFPLPLVRVSVSLESDAGVAVWGTSKLLC